MKTQSKKRVATRPPSPSPSPSASDSESDREIILKKKSTPTNNAPVTSFYGSSSKPSPRKIVAGLQPKSKSRPSDLNLSVGARKKNVAVRNAAADRVATRAAPVANTSIGGRAAPKARVGFPIAASKTAPEAKVMAKPVVTVKESLKRSKDVMEVEELRAKKQKVISASSVVKVASKRPVVVEPESAAEEDEEEEEEEEEDSDDESVARALGVPPSPRRTRSSGPPSLLSTPTKRPTPKTRPSPTKSRVTSGQLPTPSPSPAKRARTKSPTPSSSRSRLSSHGTFTSSQFSDMDEDEEEEEEATPATEIDVPEVDSASESSDDELDTLSPPRSSKSTPSKPTTSKSTLSKSKSTLDTTPRRASDRARLLPPSREIMEKAPSTLRIDVVGYHDTIIHSQDAETSPSKSGGSRQNALDNDVEEESDEEEVQAAIVTKKFIKSVPQAPATKKSKGKGKAKQNEYEASSLRQLFAHHSNLLLSGPPLSQTTEDDIAENDNEEFAFMPHYKKWEKPVRYAMRSVIKDKVGNCLILLGQKGVGKTLVVERSIKVMGEQFGEDEFVVVRISGLVHTTDRLALRAIAKQLKFGGFEEKEFDSAGDWNSQASTMSTLLTMLEPGSTTSASSAGKHKPIIIVVDEFDLFALHPRQSFLYSLLDIVQGNRRKTGMGVIGLSSRTDCLSLLEKRVRSRCQSQVHQLVPENSWENFQELAMSLLVDDGFGFDEDMVNEWNTEVENFFADLDVTTYLKRVWSIHGNNPVHLLQILTTMMSKLEWMTLHASSDWSSPGPETIPLPSLSIDLLPPLPKPRSRDDLLSHRSVLELTVCVAAKYMRIEHSNTFNLEMLYNCYLQHLRRHSAAVAIARPYTKQSFSMALDTMRSLEIFIPCVGKPSHYFLPSLSDSFRMMKFVPWAATLDEEVGGRADVPLPTKRWCKNWAE